MASITSDDILGKKAIGPQGEILGVIVKLHIDQDSKAIQGITVDQGFFKPDLFMGIEHVKRFGIDAVLLSTSPYHLLKGLKVYDSDGSYYGVVKDVVVEEHKLSAIKVARKKGLKTSEEDIPAGRIKESGETVILRPGREAGKEL
ncbi:PRC-barrel domain-containing protein [Candidatus Woesearchaeota archaeon]|nr:PRC-barrel domain-containing protein [Candidatus Woesearchaeota archaeon]